ncbi:MAG: hypothetical protein VX278_18615 [Myxococcota bacterium]|nr:hypothetical protein [Myxococcota bacterium]
MKMTSRLAFIPCILSVACTYTPAEGEWEFVDDITWISDECNVQADMNSNVSDSFEIVLIDAGFRIDGSTDCTLDGTNFSCAEPNTSTAIDFSDNGIDAVLDTVSSIGGTMRSSTSMLVEMSLSYICEGVDCDMFIEMVMAQGEDFVIPPCESIWEAEAEFSAPR